MRRRPNHQKINLWPTTHYNLPVEILRVGQISIRIFGEKPDPPFLSTHQKERASKPPKKIFLPPGIVDDVISSK